MGREIKRVPLDFDWPINKTWRGYLMPDSLDLPRCPDCESGYSRGAAWLRTYLDRLGMLAEQAEGRRPNERMHPWLAEDPYPPTMSHTGPTSRDGFWVTYPVQQPDASNVALVHALLGDDYRPSPFGYGSSETYRMMHRLMDLLDLPEDWHCCPTCKGSNNVGTDEQRAAQEAWERTDPPEGEGWQLWQTVSEGSPISPVFATAAELSEWMQSDAYHWGASGPLTKEQADAFVGVGWAPTMIFSPTTGLVPGEAAVGR